MRLGGGVGERAEEDQGRAGPGGDTESGEGVVEGGERGKR